MNTTDSGRLGEAATIAQLTKQGWYPFVDLSGKCPVDIIAWKNNDTIKVQVKTTEVCKKGTWYIQIKSVRTNRNFNTIYNFNNKITDYLACYLVPLDKVVLIPTSLVTNGSLLTIREENNNKCKLLLSEYEIIKYGSSNPIGDGSTLEKCQV